MKSKPIDTQKEIAKIDQGFDLSELKDYDLACVCELNDLCHADILLKKLEKID